MMKIKYRTRANPPKAVKTKNIDTHFIEFEKIKGVKVIDKEKDLYEIEDQIVQRSKIDLEKLTQSYKGQTGLEAVMQRVALTGDLSLLNTITTENEEAVIDATKLPKTLGEVKKMASDIQNIYNKLPEEIKSGRTASDIANNFTQEDLTRFINSQIEKAIQQQKKEVVKDE